MAKKRKELTVEQLENLTKWKMGAYLLKCKKIFYISIDISFVSTYNKCEEMEGGHRNEV